MQDFYWHSPGHLDPEPHKLSCGMSEPDCDTVTMIQEFFLSPSTDRWLSLCTPYCLCIFVAENYSRSDIRIPEISILISFQAEIVETTFVVSRFSDIRKETRLWS